jgi:hypothetical protein
MFSSVKRTENKMTDTDKKDRNIRNNGHGTYSSYKDNSRSQNETAWPNPGNKNFDASTCSDPRTYCDSEPARQSIREQLKYRDTVRVRGVTLGQAADFYRGKQAGDSENADEAKTMATLRNRTVAEALKDVRLALLFAMHHNFRARSELIRAGELRVSDKAQLQAVKERIKKGEISEAELASMPSYISAEEWSEDTKMAELMDRD